MSTWPESPARVEKKTVEVQQADVDCRRSILVSVHLPKTGGATFRGYLEQVFGDTLLIDSADRPMRHSDWSRPWVALGSRLRLVGRLSRIRCIHGHFLPCKYAYSLRAPQLVTWLRDPVARLLSHYWYWLQQPQRDFGPIHRQMHDEGWSLSRFVEEPRFWNLYSKYLRFVGLQRFSFVGITERYADSLSLFAHRFRLPEVDDLVPRRVSGSAELLESELTDTVRRRATECNAEDIVLYQQAMQLNDAMLASSKG